MKKKRISSRYIKIVEWSDEDNCFIGRIPGLIDGGIHGDDEEKVYKELCQVAEEAIELYNESGKPLPAPTANKKYSGKLHLRLSPELHERLSINAIRKGESLNKLINKALTSIM
ncbi:MAG: type II toxin-antitoxin system HicB family antitoxin [Candidatus Anammoxibacter sp.]